MEGSPTRYGGDGRAVVSQASSVHTTYRPLHLRREASNMRPESTGESFDGLIPFSRWCGGSGMTTWKLTASGNG